MWPFSVWPVRPCPSCLLSTALEYPTEVMVWHYILPPDFSENCKVFSGMKSCCTSFGLIPPSGLPSCLPPQCPFSELTFLRPRQSCLMSCIFRLVLTLHVFALSLFECSVGPLGWSLHLVLVGALLTSPNGIITWWKVMLWHGKMNLIAVNIGLKLGRS